MPISQIIPQLRTTNLAESIRFYTETLGFSLHFQYEGFYAGIEVNGQLFHLKLVSSGSIDSVRRARRSLSSLLSDERR